MNSLVSLLIDENKQSTCKNTVAKNSNRIRMSNLAKLNTIEIKEKNVTRVDNKIKYIEFYSN